MKIKELFTYHITVPFLFTISAAILFRVGIGAYSGHLMLAFIITFFLASIYHDYKEDLWSVILWATIRVYLYTALAVGLAIFYKKLLTLIME